MKENNDQEYHQNKDQNEDYLVKALCLGGKVRIYAVRTTQLVAECQTRHDTWAATTAALGRTLSVGAMMGAMLKGNEKLTIRVQGGGPIGKILVDANGRGEVRGYVDHPHINFPLNEEGKLDVGKAVGKEGFIYVTKDLGMKEPYQGSSSIVSGEIGEDFTVYFAQSEQTPSAVAVGVMVNPDHTVKASGGYIIQLLPGVTDEFITNLEKRLGSIPPVSTMVDLGFTPEKMIETVFVDEDIQWLDRMPITYTCHCSEERVKQTLISLGLEQLQQIIDEDGEAEVNCHFCNSSYHLSQPQLEQLTKEIKHK
jgi:molecular chaperone Hsp33